VDQDEDDAKSLRSRTNSNTTIILPRKDLQIENCNEEDSLVDESQSMISSTNKSNISQEMLNISQEILAPVINSPYPSSKGPVLLKMPKETLMTKEQKITPDKDYLKTL